MAKLTDTLLRGLKQGERKSESLEFGGSLVAWHKASGAKEFYYRKRKKGEKEINVKLGGYPELTLSKARQKAKEMAERASEVVDLKFLLEEERRQQQEAEDAAKAERERLSRLGTFDQLLTIYIDKMRADGRSTWSKVERSLDSYVRKPFPDLLRKKANLVTTDDVVKVLAAMVDRGITTQTNRVRGYLHAAFNVGVRFDYDPATMGQSDFMFDLTVNPVVRIKKNASWERVSERHLSDKELQLAWDAAPEIMNPVYSALFRLMVCTGFHSTELLRLKVKDVDLLDRTIYMVETKSGVPNLIPLNRFAVAELEPLMSAAPDSDLFPSRVSRPKSNTYTRASVVTNQVARLCKSLPQIESFAPRDIRRTVKTLMGKAGISKEIRDRLQNHAVGDVSGKHYDRYDYWKEKQEAMLKWEHWLAANVVEPGQQQSNVISVPFRAGSA